MYLSTGDPSVTVTTISSLGVEECDYQSKCHGFALVNFCFFATFNLYIFIFTCVSILFIVHCIFLMLIYHTTTLLTNTVRLVS
jgi:hypothetical protein